MKTGFFAYSSNPQYCEEVIESAITEINNGELVKIASWKHLEVNGKFILDEVIDSILKADFFCADLTGLNDNVLFELGYAIGANKPIWLIFDNTHAESVRRYRELDFFSTIGYSNYTKTNHIVESFYSTRPFEKNTALDDLTSKIAVFNDDYQLLLLKNQIDSNYSDTIVKCLKEAKFKYILDDASETKTQTLYWYLSRLLKVASLLAEFSATDRTGYEIQNSKCSFFSGIAHGLEIDVLMICEEPYETPLDYKDLLKKHYAIEECRRNTNEFLEDVKRNYFDLADKSYKFRKSKKRRNILQNINFGEYIAEHERNNLYSYYVETTAYNELIKHEYNIVIGRKGSGKTATLYYLEEQLKDDPRNHVCIIKPISFELEGVLHILSTTPDNFEKSYLIESAWKFIVYTEIARSIYEELKNKLPYTISENEHRFIDFVEQNKIIFVGDFYERINDNLNKIKESIQKEDHVDFKVRISEIMHVQFISEIRDKIFEVCDKNIYLLIDNLDKSWRKESHLEYQSRWILGLIGLTDRITREFASARKTRKNYEFRMTVFLRSDIFRHVLRHAREPDKISHIKLKVEDKDTLFHIVEERFVELSRGKFVFNDLWENYLPNNIDGVDIRDYIYHNIIPRPRDILYFFSKIKEIAAIRGHDRFEIDDIHEAYKDYSEWVFSSILVENGITVNQMEDFIYELVGENILLTKDELINKAKKANVTFIDDSAIESFIDHLVELSVIGREVQREVFVFGYDLDDNRKFKVLANRLGSNRYKIHNALIPALECEIK